VGDKMTLTSSQLTLVKAEIDANTDLNSLPDNTDGDIEIARLLSLDDTPSYWVWKTNVPTADLLDSIVGESLITLPTDKGTGLNTLVVSHAGNGFNPSIAGNRDIFLDPSGQDGLFTGGTNSNPTTRTQVEALFKRLALRVERVLATNTTTGTEGSPDNLDFEGKISSTDVRTARNLP